MDTPKGTVHYDYRIQAWVNDEDNTIEPCEHPNPYISCTACYHAGEYADEVTK